MLTAALFAATLFLDGGQVAVIAGPPPPAASRSTPVEAGGETRRVCRLERATGSNMQQRVCRDVSVNGVQSQQTREFMRGMQRMRLPDEGAQATPGGPNG